MNRMIRIACALILISSLISCKKDSDPDANKTRLSKLISWSPFDPSKNIVITEFKYDDQKRVTEIARFYGDSVNGEIKRMVDIHNLKFFYNGNNKNPYKSTGGMD